MGVLLGDRLLQVGEPVVEARGGDAAQDADLARYLEIGATGRLDRRRRGIGDPVDGRERGVHGVAMLGVGLLEQRAVDVEEQQQKRIVACR